MSIETLGQAWSAGWRVKARCLGRDASTKKGTRPCLRNIDIDMGTLLWTRGRDFPISMLPQRLKCPSCGCRQISVMFDVPTDRKRA
ncbi:hypothetical protein [Kaistia sp. MMO-174]|uniref:hypothetical protein n=1 Tax=Kaistia sp. MMO-174 TaxID=3081256 RepID=UPI00301760B2